MTFVDFDGANGGGFPRHHAHHQMATASKVRRNSMPYAQPSSVVHAHANNRPTSERLAEELLLTSRPIAELQRHATRSASSVYTPASILRNASSGAIVTFRDGGGGGGARANPHRSCSSTTTSSSSRIIRPYVTHYSDSGFSSALSTGSSCSYLPPPPPYRHRSGTSGSDGLSESTPKLITLSAGAIRIGGGGPLPAELFSMVVAPPSNSNEQQPHANQQPSSDPPHCNTNVQIMQQQLINQIPQQQYQQQHQQQFVAHHKQQFSGGGNRLDDENNLKRIQNAHRIHRSLSDSRYGQQVSGADPTARLLGRVLATSETNNSVAAAVMSQVNSLGALSEQNNSFLGFPLEQQTSAKIGNSDPYVVGNRGSSWTNSQVSLSPSPSMSTVSCPEYPELNEKLRRLAITRDTLSLQVAVLHDQVGAQKEKIRDLESLLDSKRKLYSYEALTKQSSAAQQADLLNEIADLKAKFQAVQREKSEAEKRLQSSQAEIERLTNSIQALMSQHSGPVQRLLNTPANGENQEMEQLRLIVQKLMADNEKKKAEINSLRSQLNRGSPARQQHAPQNGYTADENGVITGLGGELTNDNSTTLENRANMQQNGNSPTPTPPFPPQQANNQEIDINAQLRRLLVDDCATKENMAHSSSFPAGLCSGGQQQSVFGHPTTGSYVPPRIPPSASYLSSLSAGAAPLPPSGTGAWALATPRHQLHHTTSLFAQPTHSQAYADGIHGPASPAARQLAAELDEIRRVTGDAHMLHPQNNIFATTSLPRTLHTKSASALHLPRSKLTLVANGGASSSTIGGESSTGLPPTGYRRGSSVLGGGASTAADSLSHTGGGSLKNASFLQRWLGRSTRNLHTQAESDDELTRGRVPSNSTTTSNGKFKRGRARSTLRNIFGKLKRSTSQEIRGASFNRGNGIRSSASARVVSLGAPLTGNIPIRPLVNQFCDWSTEVVCEWLAEVGFGQYIPEAEKAVRSGRHLLNMSNADLEKEVGIRNLLHRKKLRCLLNCIERNTTNTPEPADRLDVHQVMLWLDDIGLPQLRDIFAENMIDGQMLLCLTVQDLVEMKVVSAMNHATIARGVQFLRSVDFNTGCLQKTFTGDVTQMSNCPNLVEKWAHSCVVQWLKSIDLAEFTPNMMFSGVHGALMVHDPTFTAESLAEVLQIPAHKTLLRRHLTTHFNNIVGQEIISYKRELLTQPHVTFLSPALRIRLVKKGFSLVGRKRDKNVVYVEPDYPVCPADVSMMLSSSRSSNSFVDTSNV